MPLSPDDLAVMPTARDDDTSWVPCAGTVLEDDPAMQATNRAVAQTRFAAEPAPGDSIGRFQVREILGRGGMGVVVSALDPRLQRQVAIKLVKPMAGDGTDSEAKARILREARAMAQFRHPNIVSVFEVGEHNGGVYVAMEQVEGGTLREALQRMEAEGSADWRGIIGMFAKAGRGLAAAHATGMVHRDFKPDNVLIDSHDRVLVSDFGIVMNTDARYASARSDVSTPEPLASGNEVVGTPAYMAPEQHEGKAVDARADQFSFCVALYEALYGMLPFRGVSYLSYREAVRNGDVRPTPTDRRVPEWLRRVLVRGLSADPDQRFASMEELLVELGVDPRQSLRLGGRERMAFVASLAAFAVIWSLAVSGFSVELSYQLHYITDGGFLGLTIVLGWLARHALARSALNQHAFQFVAANAIALLVLDAGGQLLGITAATVGALHMLVIGTASLVAVSIFGRRVILMALAYLIGFLISAAYPDWFLPILVTAHAIGAATAVEISRTRRLEGEVQTADC